MNYSYLGLLGISFVIAIIMSFLILPVLKKKKIGQNERDDGPKSHLKKQGTPTMGGIIMIATLVILTIALIRTQNTGLLELSGISVRLKHILPLIFVTLGFGSIGFLDDYLKMKRGNTEGLKPLYKMAGLTLIATIYIVYTVYVTKLGTETYIPILKQFVVVPVWIYIPFNILVMLASTNSVNLTDGIDGLCSSVSIIILLALSILGVIFRVNEVIFAGIILVGVCLAFLLFNAHPAKVFMGDTGSLFLGGAISVLAMQLQAPLILIVVAIIPVMEALSDIIQVLYYKKTKKRFFKMAPIHHHFELSGWSETKIVSVFDLITLVGCLIAIWIV